MAEKVTIGNCELWLGDFREVLPLLPKCDAVVTDPPYGINWSHSGCGGWGNGSSRLTGKKKPEAQTAKIYGDTEPFDPSMILTLAPLVLTWGAIHYTDKLPISKHWIVWDKHLATSGLSFAECDFAWTNAPGNAVIHRQLWNGCLVEGEERINRNGRTRQHPTQKPVRLMRVCIERLKLKPGSMVLDPYMGSGTTGVAAIELGYAFVGVEIDVYHFETACERIEKAQAQGQLFAKVGAGDTAVQGDMLLPANAQLTGRPTDEGGKSDELGEHDGR